MFTHKNDILLTPIEYLKGVGPQRGELLRKELGIHTFGDMLTHYPFRYMDRSSFIKIKDIPEDGAFVQIIGKIIFSEIVGTARARRLVASFKDDTGMIELVWFQGISWLEKVVANGGHFLVYGKAVRFNGFWSITHPELDKLESVSQDQFQAFQPVYPSSEKLRVRSLSGRNYVKLVQGLFSMLHATNMPEILPSDVVSHFNLLPRYEAVCAIHFPPDQGVLQRAVFRLKFEELFVHQIGICKLKLNQKYVHGFRFEKVGDLFNQFYSTYLPFELTDDQKKVLREIRLDTQTGAQMNRLLQGDVGSGKTIVALLCMLLAIDNGFQACLMAPTEILAQQHFIGITDLLKDMPICVSYLSGNIKGKARKEVLRQLSLGEIHILIGTHALIEDPVIFKNLGLCIIDEQHRFGVAQRAKLWKKNVLPPHVLVMTATPIPRTLAMTSYGDLEVSVIKQLPPGRKPITTIHRNEIHRAKVMDFIRHEVDQGRQAYIVYPLIQESEKVDYENLEAGYEQVKQFFHAHTYNICKVHGKMPLEDKEQNMNAFIKGNAHIMVATTVIEVGVNVPNASVMLIESAERFGLSQLHQLRGRVGRGADKSYCILLTSSKLTNTGRERMETMVNETSGFAIAEKDLELRGPGEIDGTRQSGTLDLHLADIVKDVALMEITRNAAIVILKEDPDLLLPQNQNLRLHLLSKKDKEIWSRIS
jgi:ATP-dependent DNA helicase RecG